MVGCAGYVPVQKAPTHARGLVVQVTDNVDWSVSDTDCTEAGLAHEHHFGDGLTRYEIAQEHHDHLVCTKCGKIVEFECRMIESAQEEIAVGEGGMEAFTNRLLAIAEGNPAILGRSYDP